MYAAEKVIGGGNVGKMKKSNVMKQSVSYQNEFFSSSPGIRGAFDVPSVEKAWSPQH